MHTSFLTLSISAMISSRTRMIHQVICRQDCKLWMFVYVETDLTMRILVSLFPSHVICRERGWPLILSAWQNEWIVCIVLICSGGTGIKIVGGAKKGQDFFQGGQDSHKVISFDQFVHENCHCSWFHLKLGEKKRGSKTKKELGWEKLSPTSQYFHQQFKYWNFQV